MLVLITGTDCSGKSSLIMELEARGYKVVHEAARRLMQAGDYHPCIDFEEFQFVLAWTIERDQSKLDRTQVTFLDRSVLDAVAYYRVAGKPIPEFLSTKSPSRYDHVFILEPLTLVKDGVRYFEDQERMLIQDHLKDIYPDHRLVPDLGSAKERADFILEEIFN